MRLRADLNRRITKAIDLRGSGLHTKQVTFDRTAWFHRSAPDQKSNADVLPKFDVIKFFEVPFSVAELKIGKRLCESIEISMHFLI